MPEELSHIMNRIGNLFLSECLVIINKKRTEFFFYGYKVFTHLYNNVYNSYQTPMVCFNDTFFSFLRTNNNTQRKSFVI